VACGLALPETEQAFDIFVYLREGKRLTRSRAFFALLQDVWSGWRWLRVF